MNTPSGPADTAAVQAEQHLVRLNGQVDSLRAVLIRLLQDVVVAEKRLGNSESGHLLEANERLVVAALLNQTDIETASRALDIAARSAERDALTQLPNRLLLLDSFALAINNARRSGTRLGLLFIDLDKFKRINDTLGHAVGDEALKHVARCLASSVAAADTVSRYGGDEFVVLLADVSHGADALLVADQMIALLNQPCQIGGHQLHLSASIGVSIFPDDGEDAITLIERADAAMYRAKREGPGTALCHSDRVEPGPAPKSLLHAALPALRLAFADPLAAQADRNDHLREANEQLVLAALDAQVLQDAMLDAQRRQREFLTGVANELSDPMAPIRLAAAQLGLAPSHEALLPRAQAIIEHQAAHMSRLVGDLLDMVNGHAGRLRFKRESVDLISILDAAITFVQPAMAGRHQHFSSQLPARPLTIHGHPGHLSQIVGNLLDNASKYTPDGGQISLSATRVGSTVEIRVVDSGLGITADALPNVFAPFAQDTHAIGFNGIGLGIGLTVVKELVEAHGGTVVASSGGRGQGSLFLVTLPVSGALSTGLPVSA